MEIKHELMTITLSEREQNLLIEEYKKLRFGEEYNKKNKEFYKDFPNVHCLLESIQTCNNNKSHTMKHETDYYSTNK